jgi:hypothetical protein
MYRLPAFMPIHMEPITPSLLTTTRLHNLSFSIDHWLLEDLSGDDETKDIEDDGKSMGWEAV